MQSASVNLLIEGADNELGQSYVGMSLPNFESGIHDETARLQMVDRYRNDEVLHYCACTDTNIRLSFRLFS